MDEPRPLYPSNTNYGLTNQKQQEPRHKLEPVTKNAKLKPSMGKRLAKAFVGSDIQDVGSYFIWECIVPSVKYAILDSIMMIFGEPPTRRNYARGNYQGGTVNYNAQYRAPQQRERQVASTIDTRYSCDDIIYESKGEALQVLDMLLDRIVDYKAATVADVYDLSGITVNDHTMYNWGWTDLSTAEVRRTREGWYIAFPRVQDIK